MLLKAPEYVPDRTERYHPVMDAPVLMKDGSTVAASKLADRFFDSDYGQSMLEQPYRYATNFGYDRGRMLDDNGFDHCPIGHQRELPYHFGKIIEREQALGSPLADISDLQQGTLALTMQTHDNGESIHNRLVALGFTVVGDIPAGQKRPIDRLNEARIRAYFDGLFLSDVHPSVLAEMEAITSHEDDTILHDYFEAAHAVQTFETSNRAYHRLRDEVWYGNGEVIDLSVDAEEGARLSGLLGISRVVYHQSFSTLEAFSQFDFVREFAAETRALRS